MPSADVDDLPGTDLNDPALRRWKRTFLAAKLTARFEDQISGLTAQFGD
jgi:hypothetical protein